MTTLSNQPPNEEPDFWGCPTCGESVDPAFDICWQCGTTRDGVADPDFDPAVVNIREQITCKGCNYPLKALTNDRCPECGRPFDREIVDTPRQDLTGPRWQSLSRQTRAALLVLLVALACLPIIAILITSGWFRGDRIVETLHLAFAINLIFLFVSLIAAIVSAAIDRPRRHAENPNTTSNS